MRSLTDDVQKHPYLVIGIIMGGALALGLMAEGWKNKFAKERAAEYAAQSEAWPKHITPPREDGIYSFYDATTSNVCVLVIRGNAMTMDCTPVETPEAAAPQKRSRWGA